MADILVVDPSGPPGLDLNRHPSFTDELPGRFIEADHLALRVRWLATYSAWTVGMHHIFSRHGFGVSSASRRPTVVPDRVSWVVRRTN